MTTQPHSLLDLDQLLTDAKREAWLAKRETQRAQATPQAPSPLRVEKTLIPKQANYKWSAGPIVALMVNGEFLGMFQETTCKRVHARRLTHLNPEAELTATPQVVEHIPQWKEPSPRESLLEMEVIKSLPSNIELIRTVVERNRRLSFTPKPDVEGMLEELGLRDW
jgi:hypothetical protein